MSEAVIVAAVSGGVSLAAALLSFAGSQMAANSTKELTLYRIGQLEEKVNRHNHLVERMYELEKRVALIEDGREE